MKVDGTHYRSIWFDADADELRIIDQRWLPHDFRVATLDSVDAVADRDPGHVVCAARRLIGATAAWGVAIAMRENASDAALDDGVARAARDAPHRDQPALGARPDGAGPAPAARRARARGGRVRSRRRRSPTRTSRSTAGSACTVWR